MSKVKIVIVGGVAGGASAAAKARRTNEAAEIVLFERGPYVSFANCGLPYYIGNAIKDRDELFLQDPEGFWQRYRVAARVRHEVLAIHRDRHVVSVRDLQTGREFDESYDRLILAPGAGAVVPPLPGIDAANIFTVKTVPDSDRVKAFIEEDNARRALVIGGGFIGLETAEALKERGLDVTLVEMQSQVLPPLDTDMGALVSTHLRNRGIRLMLEEAVTGFTTVESGGRTLAVEATLRSGKTVPADLVILSIGVRPELKLARDAGLRIGDAGGIAVDDRMATSDPDIYAAGDAVETVHLVSGQRARIPLAGPANKQGRIAGANAAGGQMRFPGAIGTAIVESLGITAAKTGLGEKEAAAAGLRYYPSYTHSQDHAGYYPGALMMHIKLICEQDTGRLLGAQIVGEQGVDKRIDVLATAITARMTVTDLENLDLAYAPQFSSAKDPVIMAGFVAANALRGEVRTMTCEALMKELPAANLQLVDVRTAPEFDGRHLPGAALIPVDELRDRLHELDPARDTVVYCRSGLRAYLATRILMQNGFRSVRNVSGGIMSCQEPASTA